MEPHLTLVFEKSYGDESYGLVYRNTINGQFEVYEITPYGSCIRLEGTFPADQEAEAVALAKTFV